MDNVNFEYDARWLLGDLEYERISKQDGCDWPITFEIDRSPYQRYIYLLSHQEYKNNGEGMKIGEFKRIDNLSIWDNSIKHKELDQWIKS